jgi:hypothetical protein
MQIFKENFNLHASRKPSDKILAKSSRSSCVKPAFFLFVDGFAKSIV